MQPSFTQRKKKPKQTTPPPHYFILKFAFSRSQGQRLTDTPNTMPALWHTPKSTVVCTEVLQAEIGINSRHRICALPFVSCIHR